MREDGVDEFLRGIARGIWQLPQAAQHQERVQRQRLAAALDGVGKAAEPVERRIARGCHEARVHLPDRFTRSSPP